MSRMLLTTVLCIGLISTPCQADPASSPRHQGLYQHGEPPLSNLGGPLDLTRQTGQSFSLQDIRGSVALVFFGFTQCSNTCPVAMAQAQQLLAGFRSRKPPAVLFVTLDPLSDTPAALAQYLSAFDPRIIGLTGTPRQIEQAAKRYGVASQSASGTLEHSSRWYLLDDNMRVARVYKINTPVSAMAQDIVRAQTARAAATWSEGAP